MKTQSYRLLLAAGIALGMLSSCIVIDEDDTPAMTSATNSYYQPGYQINTLPSGYRTEVISGNNYYYHNGAYYRRESNGYIVVDAPRTSRYYTEYDSYRGRGRQYSTTTTSYQDPNTGNVSVITRLPTGYRTIDHGGTQYYQSGQNFYRRQGSGYVVVSRPY